MNDQGLLLIQEHRAWSSLANNLYECLNQEERDRLFELIADKNIELILEEQHPQIRNSKEQQCQKKQNT